MARRSPGGTSPIPPYKPQLAHTVKDPPAGDEWVHEMDYDGCRVGCRIDDGSVRLIGRDGKDCTEAFPEICDAAQKLGVRRALIDGEVAIVLPDGRTSLPDLQRALSGGPRRGLVYFVFDLLHVDGETLLGRPLVERKNELLRLVGKPGSRSRVRYAEHVAGHGGRMFAEACRLKLDGIVSKRGDSEYKTGRSDAWVKTKCEQRPAKQVSPRAPAKKPARITVAGVSISHPDRVMYSKPAFANAPPGKPITKLDLAAFYERIANWIVPHVEGRPLTLVRCPVGLSGECFYMKHSKVWAPPALRRVKIQEKTKVGDYLVADNIAAVVSLVQMDVLEIHTWNTCIDAVELPNRIVFDMDPGSLVTWDRVVASARLVRKMLGTVGLESFPKTTGGKGLHVVVPLVPRADWRECLEFSRAVAEAMERRDSTLFTTTFAKAGRERKILIDYMRNNRTNTSVAAFSTRARPGAPVSMTLRWEEVTPALDPSAWTVATAERRLSSLRTDPWRDYWKCKQRLPARASEAFRR